MLINLVIRSQFPQWRCSDSIFSMRPEGMCEKLGLGMRLQKSWCEVPLFRGSPTLKLCRQREPGIFSHVSTVKGRKGIEILIVHGHTWRLKTAERAKAMGDSLPYIASKGWAWSWQSDYIINNCQLFWVVLSGWSLLNLFIVYLIVYWFLLSRRYWISTATNIMSTASSSDSTTIHVLCNPEVDIM